MRLRTAARVILVGAPGVGKGTQSERLLGRFPQLAHLSSGDLLRYQVKNRTPLGIKVESTIKSGGLVPDDLIIRLIRNELNTRGWILQTGRPDILTLASSAISTSSHAASSSASAAATSAQSDAEVATFLSANKAPPAAADAASASSIGKAAPSSTAHLSDDPSASFLLDGFPRTAEQAAQLDSIVPVNLVVSLKTPFEVILERISTRWVHEPSGRVYNESFNAPKVPGHDDVTGEALVRRADDSEEVYRQRFEKFQQTSEPLLNHYAKQGVLWEVEGNSSDEISPKLFAEFERRFVVEHDLTQ